MPILSTVVLVRQSERNVIACCCVRAVNFEGVLHGKIPQFSLEKSFIPSYKNQNLRMLLPASPCFPGRYCL